VSDESAWQVAGEQCAKLATHLVQWLGRRIEGREGFSEDGHLLVIRLACAVVGPLGIESAQPGGRVLGVPADESMVLLDSM
jgi:hypothetical protein